MTGDQLMRERDKLLEEKKVASGVLSAYRTLESQHDWHRWKPAHEAFTKAWKSLWAKLNAIEARLAALNETESMCKEERPKDES